eukprot:COSAG01_NODE_28761_length_653_cov_1.350181_1_plen_95_part_10
MCGSARSAALASKAKAPRALSFLSIRPCSACLRSSVEHDPRPGARAAAAGAGRASAGGLSLLVQQSLAGLSLLVQSVAGQPGRPPQVGRPRHQQF